MKNKAYTITLLYLFLAVSGSLYCIGEKTIRIGGDSSWEMAVYRNGIAEVNQVRPFPVLTLSSSAAAQSDSNIDLLLSFDEGHPSLFRDSAGNYRMTVSPSLGAVDRRYARSGFGAALFPSADVQNSGKNSGGENLRMLASGRMPAGAGGPLILEIKNDAALFAPNNRFRDFTIEFWLHPMNLENGDQILWWNASRPEGKLQYSLQRVLCASSKNRLQWTFQNFFVSPDNAGSIDIIVTGCSPVVPKTWSHHLVRFDSNTGLIEYLMNGKSEAIEYVTNTGHEGGEVYTPVAGEGGSFTLGGGFSGMMDELRIHGAYVSGSEMRKYPNAGGRIETKAIDLGAGQNGVLMVEVSGGKTSVLDARISSEYRQNGHFRFSDDSEMQFFIRSSENPWRWDTPWHPVTPGADLGGAIRGRYVQLAADFYPSANGEASPYLEELRITYLPDEAPLPPDRLTAVASDGSVQLFWKSSPNQNVRGYLVYYGTSGDDYYGLSASNGISPIDAGNNTTINIEGLKNGTLYYFRVAAYSHRNAGGANGIPSVYYHAGEFSREVRARPLQGISMR